MFDQNALDKQMDNMKILPAVIAKYIPEEMRQHIDLSKKSAWSELKYIEGIFEGSNNKLVMYENAESLLKNLLVYMNFPLSRKVFPLEMGEYRHIMPDANYDLKGELLYCKQDYLFYLQSCVYSELRFFLNKEMPAELIEYIKKHEERLSGCYEFVKYDHETFEKIREQFMFASTLQVYKPEELEKMIITPSSEVRVYQEKNFIEVFDELISKYPWIFLPNNETKDERATVVVRVFYDRGYDFVMETELFNAINLKNPDRKPMKCEDVNEGFLKTLDYKYVLETFRDEITDIDFLGCPISHTDHSSVPIPTPTGEHCIRASDALLEVLSLSIKALKVFQKIKRNTCHMIPKFITFLEKYFPSNIKYRYFITLPLIQKLQDEMNEFWKQFKNKPTKEIRDVGPNGFTVEDLRKELKYLGYTDIFPEISLGARIVYASYFEPLKSQLTTSYMYRAVEMSVVTTVISRFPCLQEFLSRQKNCPHTGTGPCKLCMIAFEEAEAKMEAEKRAEQAAMSSADKCIESSENLENSEESVLKPFVEEALSIELNQENEDFIARVSSFFQQAVNFLNEDEEMDKLKEENVKSEASSIEKIEKIASQEEDQFDDKLLIIEEPELEISKITEEKSEETEKLKKQQESLEKENMKEMEQLKEKNSVIQKLEMKNSRTTDEDEHSKEIEKLKQQQASKAKQNKKEIEQLKRNASKSADEIKKLTAKIAEKETAENRLKRSNEEFHEKLQKSNSNLQEITRKHSHLEAEISDKNRVIEQLKRNASKSADEAKKLAAKIAEKEAAENRLKQSNNEILEKLRKSDSNLQEISKKHSHLETELTDKNRIILELQNSANKQVSEQEKAKKELETLVSNVRGLLDQVLPSEPTEKPECLICFYEMKSDQKTLKCEHCRKVVHLECASKWLKIHRSCAHCRREQLDPNEFPNLQ